MIKDKLLFELLDTQLNALQEKRLEDNLFDLLVKERLEIQKKYIETVVGDELDELTLEEKINLLKTKLL